MFIQILRVLSQLHFEPDQYFKNILKVEQYDASRTLGRFRQPVDKDVWVLKGDDSIR